MNGRDRLQAAFRGEPVDQKPVIAFPGAADNPDCMIEDPVRIIRTNLVASLAFVRSPLARALFDGTNLNDLLAEDLEVGHEALAKAVEATRAEAALAFERGADGLFYYIDGACPSVSTPMQYGGFHLEHDREILADFQSHGLNIAFIEGTDEPYLDSVSDLPAHALGWRIAESGISIESVRAMRSGPVAGTHPDADLFLAFRAGDTAHLAASAAEAQR